MDNQLTHSNESYEIGKDYAQHTFKIDPYLAPENELQGLLLEQNHNQVKVKN